MNLGNVPIQLEELDLDNLNDLKHLNATIFPVSYPARFYRELKKPENVALTRLAYHRGELVGAVCCEVSEAKSGGPRRLCISTLAVKSEYQGQSIGTRLLTFALETARAQKKHTEVYLHVQTDNHEAIRFYERFGFRCLREVKNYYRRMKKIPGLPRSKDCYEMLLVISQAPKQKQSFIMASGIISDRKLEPLDAVVVENDLTKGFTTSPETIIAPQMHLSTSPKGPPPSLHLRPSRERQTSLKEFFKKG